MQITVGPYNFNHWHLSLGKQCKWNQRFHCKNQRIFTVSFFKTIKGINFKYPTLENCYGAIVKTVACYLFIQSAWKILGSRVKVPGFKSWSLTSTVWNSEPIVKPVLCSISLCIKQYRNSINLLWSLWNFSETMHMYVISVVTSTKISK